jgi:hypothetical protein
MARPLLKEYYRHPDGKTVADHMNEMLRDGKDVIAPTAFTLEVSREGQLLHRCIDTFIIDGIKFQLWRFSDRPFHLFYSYCAARREVCFLLLHEGNPSAGVERTAKQMVRDFYS